MSTNDDKFNRTWFWRARRSKKILNNVRLRASEIFEMITTSMDHYLEVGPPVELKKLRQSPAIKPYVLKKFKLEE